MKQPKDYDTRPPKIVKRDLLGPIGMLAVWSGLAILCICAIVGAVTIGAYILGAVT